MSTGTLVLTLVILPLVMGLVAAIVGLLTICLDQSAELDAIDPSRARRRGYWLHNPPPHVRRADRFRQSRDSEHVT